MTGFCALATKSTLIPPITTFKRKKEVEKKKVVGRTQGKSSNFPLPFFSPYFYHPLESYLIYSVKACVCFVWLYTGLHNSNHKEWKSLLNVAF